MAEKTETIYVKVQTFNPATRQMIAVENASLLCEHDGFLWDPDLSDGTATTNASGEAEVEITFEEDDETSLNPYFTIRIANGNRTVPPGVGTDLQFDLPEEWTTRHNAKRRIPRITEHNSPINPLHLFVGMQANVLVAYPDFNGSHKANPRAIPENTLRIYLADHDSFIFDFLNPDDTLKGFTYNSKDGANKVIQVGENDQYDYFDVWPTQACALDGALSQPRAQIDPPREPVGRLGGRSFSQPGPVAVCPRGFVFMVDDKEIHRFYPDGTWCEHITTLALAPKGLALDQYSNLYVADTGNDRIQIFTLQQLDSVLTGSAGLYRSLASFGSSGSGNGRFDHPHGISVIPNPVIEGQELLAVADTNNHRVQVLTIAPTTSRNFSVRRQVDVGHIALAFLTEFGQPTPASGANATTAVAQAMWEPVAVACDWKKNIYVCDQAWHRTSRWTINAAGNAYHHSQDWGTPGGTASSADGEFDQPIAIACDSKHDYIYVADKGNHRVQRLNAQNGHHLVNWTGGLPSAIDPVGLAVDQRCDIFLADAANIRVLRASVFNAGVPTASNVAPTAVGSPWMPITEGEFFLNPRYCYLDSDRTLWVSDSGNNRVVSYQENTHGELVRQAGPAFAGLDKPWGICKYENHELFIADSGHHQIKKYDGSFSHQLDIGTGVQGNGDEEFDSPCGICVVKQSEPVLYVADKNNNRIKAHKISGEFLYSINTNDGNTLVPGPGGNALNAPEDVCADTEGNLYIADTGAGNIVHYQLITTGPVNTAPTFVRVITPGGHSLGKPSGVSMTHDGKLLVTDRDVNQVIKMDIDGDLIAYWDMDCFVRQDDATHVVYRPELARWLYLDSPTRAVMDDKGLLIISDTHHHQLRLLRAFTAIPSNLFDLGQGLFDRDPDISFRAVARANWEENLGLQLDASHEFETEPENDVSDDNWQYTSLLHSEDFNSEVVNVMKVARMVQHWTQGHSRAAPTERQWGLPSRAQNLSIDIDASGSYFFLEVNMGDGNSGRGSDGWDDSVVAHEMAHWIFTRNTGPYPVLPLNPWRWHRMSQAHSAINLTSFDQALSEGWGEYIEHFWGGEFAHTDRLVGFPLTRINGVAERGASRVDYVYGGPRDTLGRYNIPTFDTPEQGLKCEGYFANCLYQIHRFLCDTDVGFADSSAFWHGYNSFVTQTHSQRFSDIIWMSLKDFQDDPPFYDGGSTVLLKKILSRTHTSHPGFAQTVQSLYELNNLLMPVMTISKGTSTSDSGNDLVSEEMEVTEGSTENIIIHIKDAAGHDLPHYNILLKVTSGNAAHYSFTGGSTPPVEHGRATPSAPPANEKYFSSNASGIINFSISPGAATAGNHEEVVISYQPDFDTDSSFSLPLAGDNQGTMYQKLYLYQLRGAVKSWGGSGDNFGAIVKKTLRVEVKSP